MSIKRIVKNEIEIKTNKTGVKSLNIEISSLLNHIVLIYQDRKIIEIKNYSISIYEVYITIIYFKLEKY